MLPRLKSIFRRLLSDTRANVAIIFALSSIVVVTAIGAGLDLSHAYVSRQELSHVATLTCQYSTRPTIVAQASNGNASAYTTQVNNFAAHAVQNQELQQTQTNSAAFTYVQGGQSSVTVSASVPTYFMGIIGVNTMPLSVTVPCSAGQTESSTPSTTPISESFENSSCTGQCYSFANQNGGTSPPATSQAFNGKVAYTGITGNQWSVSGYCLEIDSVGVIRSTVADGTHSAELDCDNGAGTAGNSAISTKTYLSAGTYELRYSFASRVAYPNYDPTYICASTAADLTWAKDTYSVGSPVSNALRTNQINVYLDPDQSGAPPMHTTMDGTQTLAGSNLIDMCVQSYNWVQRSVKITITTPGYYWLSFAADGQNDSYGGQLDNILLCQNTCSGTVKDNFPTQWKSAPNLFEDTFDSPLYVADYSNWINKSGNLNISTGTTGTILSGWPGAIATGWATAPFNQMNYILQGAYQGLQYLSMDGYNSNGNTLRNRAISRSFYLDPGYYQVTYDYISDVDLSQGGYTGSLCINAPASGYIVGTPSSYATSAGYIRFYQSTTANLLTNLVGVFMASSQLISTPIGGGALNSTTSYNNPDGTVSTTPTVAPDTVNYASYDSTQVNPLLDWCNYSSNFNWLTRSTYVKITKPGQYWITFSANGGSADGNGGGIDDVKLIAFGSLYGSVPSGATVTIPTISPAPNSTYTNNGAFTGFSIVADPLQP